MQVSNYIVTYVVGIFFVLISLGNAINTAMIKKYFYLLVIFVLSLTACTDDIEQLESKAPEPLIIVSETNLEGLTSFANSGAIGIYENWGKDLNLPGKDDDDDDDDDNDDDEDDHEDDTDEGTAASCQYALTVVFTVNPPWFDDRELLSATDIHISGRYAYVSYNKAGIDYRGALDIIDMDDPDNPRLTGRLYFANADMNSVIYKEGYVYAGGGVNADLLETADSYAFVCKIPVDGDHFDLSNGITYGFQDGKTTTDMILDGDTLFASSGIEGYLGQYNNADLSKINEIASPDLRALAFDGGNLVALEANMGVMVCDTDLNLIREIPINSDFIVDAKRNLDLFEDRLLVAEGTYGAGHYSFSSGQFIEHIPITNRPPDAVDSDIVTNAVSSNQDMILMANGGAGLSLSAQEANGAISTVGVLGLPGSINDVDAGGDYIVAASGGAGMIVIKCNEPDPDVLDRCEDLPEYEGDSELVVQEEESIAFKGSYQFNGIKNNGSLLLCGAWTVVGVTHVNPGSLFELIGMMTIGNNNKRKNLIVKENSVFKLEGELTVYGNLILQDNATLECIGTENKINVHGNVTMGGNVSITGTFEDVQDKF